MSTRHLGIITAVLVLITALYYSCASDNEARVTIRLVRNDLAMVTQPSLRLSLVDRVLRLFSTPAHAYSYYWDSTKRNILTLTVSNPSLPSVEFPLPPGATEFSAIVPAGDVTLKILSLGNNQDTGFQYYNWGGITTVTLNPGDDKTVTIYMVPIIPVDPGYTSVEQGGSVTITLYPVVIFSTPYSAYQLLLERSNNPGGPYQVVGTGNWPTGGNPTVSDTESQTAPGIPAGTYYYRVRIRTGQGVTGLPCEPFAVSFSPIY